MTVEIAEQRQELIDLKTGHRRPVVPQVPLLSSASAGWDGIILEQHAGLALELGNVAIPQHLILLQLSGAAIYDWKIGDAPRRNFKVQPGQLTILPAMTPVSVRTLNSGGFLSLTMEPKFLLCVAHQSIDPNGYELKVRVAHEDPMLRACLLALQRESESAATAERLYAEAVATTVAAHLVRHHLVQQEKESFPAGRGGLSRHLFGRAIEFMQSHLSEEISLRTLASAVGLSPYYFSRLFKESTGSTPHQYLIQCRVQRGKELLLVSGLSISEVALQAGFCDQSHFSAHFKRVYGVTPREFIRRAGKRVLCA